MRIKTKRIISLLLTVIMIISMLPTVLAAGTEGFIDFPTGWSKTAMEAAVANGLLTGYDNNEIRPTANLTRAEFAAIISRAFGAKTVADISQYSDVSKDDWYYDYIAKVVKMGAMNGVSNTAMNPDANITREEVFTAVSRVLVLSDSDISGLSKFKDSAKVSSWAANSMSALTKRGYVNGDNLGNANPRANITREEFAQFMYNAIRTYITKSGTYDKDMEGIVVLRTGDVELKNLSITSDLVIGDGVLEDSVKITNVKVEKRLLARGGTVTLKNTTLGENVVVNNVNGITFFKNYRDEKVFKGIVENTEARFLTRTTGGGGGGVSTITVTVDGVTKTVNSGTTIDSIKSSTERLGYKYDWEDGQGNDIADGTVLTNGMVIVSNETLMQYPLSYFDEDGVTSISFKAGYIAAPNFNIENKNTTVLPASTNINKPGWRLVKWVNMTTGADVPPLTVTADMTETDGVKLKAVFELIDFEIAFDKWKVEGETTTETFTPETMFTDAYKLSKAEKFNISVGIKDGKLLPTNSDIKHPGYKFLKWVDKNGDEVTNANIKERITNGIVTESTTTLNLTAVFEVVDFDIAFTKWELEDGTDSGAFNTDWFASGYQKPEEFNIVSGILDGKILPVDENIINAGYELVKLTDESGAEVTNANIKNFIAGLVEGDKTTLNVVAVFKIKPYKIAYKYKAYEKKEDLSYALLEEGDFFTGNPADQTDTGWFTEKIGTDFDIKNPYSLPLPAKVSNLGYKFLGWYDENDNKLTTPISVNKDTPDEKAVYAKFELIKYNLKFQSVIKKEDGTLEDAKSFNNDWFISSPNDTFDVRAPYVLPLDSNVYRPGYTFLGWYYPDENDVYQKITTLAVNEKMNPLSVKVYARFKMNNYTVNFYNGSQLHKSYTYNILNYNGELEPGITFADVHKSLTLDNNEFFINWYELVGDGQGGLKQQKVSALTEDHLYKEDGVVLDLFANTADHAPLKIQFFKGYKQPTHLADESVLLEEEQGGWYYNYYKTKFEADINTAAIKGSSNGLYDKSKYVDIYPSGSIYTVTPDFWYLKDGQFNPFDELFTDPDTADGVDEYSIRVQGDPTATEEVVYQNNGYLLYKNFGVMVNFGNLSYGPINAIDISTKYSRTSRIADSVKVLGDQLGLWIERLKNYNPTLYNKLTGEVYEKLEEKDLIDENKNIKITKLPVPVSAFVKKETADKIVKDYISKLINNPEQLRNILSMIDIQSFVNDIGANEVIKTLSNAQIAQLMKDNKSTVVDFVVKDLKSAEPKLKDAVVDFAVKDLKSQNSKLIDKVAGFVANDGAFKTSLIDEIIAELKSDEPSSWKDFVAKEAVTNTVLQGKIVDNLIADIKAGTISDEILAYIKGSTLIADVVVADLAKGDASVLRTTVVSYIQTAVQGTDLTSANLRAALVERIKTEVGGDNVDLRYEIVTGDALDTLLAVDEIKTAIIDLLINDKAFRDSVLDNKEFRFAFLDNAINNKEFETHVVMSDAFETKIKELLQTNEDLKDSIRAALLEDVFVDMIIKAFKTHDYLKAILQAGSLRDAVLNEITLDHYIVSEDDLMRYVFSQGGVVGNYTDFITQAEIESILAAEINGYDSMSDAEKQAVKDVAYTDDTIKDEVKAEILNEFETYKANILDDFLDGNTITAKAEETIHDEIIFFINSYLDGNITNDEEKAAIENLLIEMLREVITSTSLDPTLEQFHDQVRAQEETALHNVDAATMEAIVDEYLVNDTNKANLTIYVGTMYNSLTPSLATFVKGVEKTSVMYGKMDALIKSNVGSISDDTLESFLKSEITNASVVGVIEKYLTDIAANGTDEEIAEIKGYITSAIKNGTLTNAQIKTELQKYANANDISSTLLSYVQTLTEDDIKGYLPAIMATGEDEVRALIQTEIDKMTVDELITEAKKWLPTASAETVEQKVNGYLNTASEDDLKAVSESFLDMDNLEDFVADNREVIESALSGNVDISEFANADFVIDYVNGLDGTQKTDFADKLYDVVSKSQDYSTLIDQLLTKDEFVITKSNLAMVQAIKENIEGLTFDDIVARINNNAVNKMIDLVGKDMFITLFNRSKNNYINCLNEKIEIVKLSSSENVTEKYTTKVTIEANVIDEILKPIYDKALPKAIEKLEGIDRLKYNKNDKLKYLVEHDIFEKLLTYTATTDAELTGYQIKDVIDYYNYVLGLFIVADDAICWYGDDLTEEEFNAIRDAAFEKFYIVKDKVDKILADYTATGELPQQVENLLEKVQRVNNLFLQMEGRLKSLINKYLSTNLDNLNEKQKVQYVIDAFFGEEEPTFTIDTLYALFYAYDDKVQAKMQEALNSGKLQKAIAKFEASRFGKLFTSTNVDESLLTLITNIANNGVEQYKVANTDVTIQDVYKFVIAGNEFTLRRTYMKD